jgi:hypothetical protein
MALVLSPSFAALLLYSVISTGMVISNKLVLSSYGFQFPMVLMFHQNLMTVNCLHIAKQLNWITYEELNRKQMLQVSFWSYEVKCDLRTPTFFLPSFNLCTPTVRNILNISSTKEQT